MQHPDTNFLDRSGFLLSSAVMALVVSFAFSASYIALGILAPGFEYLSPVAPAIILTVYHCSFYVSVRRKQVRYP